MDTLTEKGWSEKGNGELLDFAEQDGYDVLVTTDQNMRHEQNLAEGRIGIVVLLANAWPRVRRHATETRKAIAAVRPAKSSRCPFGAASMAADTSEAGLERLICTALAGHACEPPVADEVRDVRAAYGVSAGSAGSSSSWTTGASSAG